MNCKSRFNNVLFLLVAVFLAAGVYACSGRQAQPEQAAVPEVSTAKLDKNYTKILCYAFGTTPEIAKDYPNAVSELQNSMVTALQTKKQFKEVGIFKQSKRTSSKTLLVKGDITSLRIVSGAARFWGGVFAGSSGIELKVQLIDGGTRKVVREEIMNSSNNAWAASYAFGSSDRSLPSDMGQIVADYITAIMPAK